MKHHRPPKFVSESLWHVQEMNTIFKNKNDNYYPIFFFGIYGN